MTFICTINLDNAAFADNPHELARLLRKMDTYFAEFPPTADDTLPRDGSIHDANGSKCGKWEIR